MLFSPMKATLELLIERVESIFVDSVMIELDLNDHKSELTKKVVLCLVYIPCAIIFIHSIGLVRNFFRFFRKFSRTAENVLEYSI